MGHGTPACLKQSLILPLTVVTAEVWMPPDPLLCGGLAGWCPAEPCHGHHVPRAAGVPFPGAVWHHHRSCVWHECGRTGYGHGTTTSYGCSTITGHECGTTMNYGTTIDYGCGTTTGHMCGMSVAPQVMAMAPSQVMAVAMEGCGGQGGLL